MLDFWGLPIPPPSRKLIQGSEPSLFSQCPKRKLSPHLLRLVEICWSPTLGVSRPQDLQGLNGRGEGAPHRLLAPAPSQTDSSVNLLLRKGRSNGPAACNTAATGHSSQFTGIAQACCLIFPGEQRQPPPHASAIFPYRASAYS